VLTTRVSRSCSPRPGRVSIVAFVLGAGIGLLKLVRSPTLQLILPIAAAFVCATAVFLLAEVIEIGDPIRLLIAPLVTFLAGGVLTSATVELAAGQMISGAARLVYGFVQLALLAFGILAAGEPWSGWSPRSYEALDARIRPAVVGRRSSACIVFALGNYLHFSAPPVDVRLGASGPRRRVRRPVGGNRVRRPTRSAVSSAPSPMTPVVLWIADLRHGAPSQLTFLPAFWLLVPGAAGLVGLTEAFATDGGLSDFTTALVSIMSIALGVLIGTALYRVVHHGAEEFVQFAVALPAAPEAEREPTVWSRLTEPWRRLGLNRADRRR
jgi:hypothetical protein